MASTFTKQATAQLSPAYDAQAQALSAQTPAINQLYDALYQGLNTQRQTGTQNILEGAGGKGLLHSTIPVDQQTGLEQTILQQRSQYGAEQAQKLAGVRSALADLGVNKAQAISQLAELLHQQDLQRQQFKYQQQMDSKQLQQQRALADREYQLKKQLAAQGIF